MKCLTAVALAAAAISAPAFAETVTYYLWDPVQNTYVERQVERAAPQPTVTYTYPAPASTTHYTENVVTYTAPATTYTAPSVTYVDATPSYSREIVVTAPRSIDQAITNDVVDRIAGNPTISGQIGVETHNRDVTLTGRTTTEGQMERAEREARSVDGVRDVNNRIWPRVGKF